MKQRVKEKETEAGSKKTRGEECSTQMIRAVSADHRAACLQQTAMLWQPKVSVLAAWGDYSWAAFSWLLLAFCLKNGWASVWFATSCKNIFQPTCTHSSKLCALPALTSCSGSNVQGKQSHPAQTASTPACSLWPPKSPHHAVADALSNTHSCSMAATFPVS